MILQPNRHLLPKGSEGEAGELEMLLAEGNADDGDAEEQAEENVHEPRPKAAENNPEDIEGKADAAGWLIGRSDVGTKGEEAEKPDLEGLQREGDADNGAGESEAAGEVADGGFESAEDPPEEIAEEFHIISRIWCYKIRGFILSHVFGVIKFEYLYYLTYSEL